MSQAQHSKPTGEEKQDSQEHPLLLAFGRMQNMLLDTARRILHSHEDAEDALQEAFVRLWSRSERIKDEKDASAMLYVTTRNISISSLRRRNTNRNVETGQTQENITPSHEEELEREETFY
ncbi:MAG: sigma-70 family RNA polymerase sigma factor, partial [Bacteroidaceae bacterium]|nr:sigma-70 family RNA polymerase sigma factor [Bacteroidaceae bacterium]